MATFNNTGAIIVAEETGKTTTTAPVAGEPNEWRLYVPPATGTVTGVQLTAAGNGIAGAGDSNKTLWLVIIAIAVIASIWLVMRKQK